MLTLLYLLGTYLMYTILRGGEHVCSRAIAACIAFLWPVIVVGDMAACAFERVAGR